MALPGFLSQKEKSLKEAQGAFLAVRAAADTVQAAIWVVEAGQVKVESFGPAQSWEEQEELIEAADKSITAAAGSLSRDLAEPEKVVFGIPSAWVSQSKIVPERLEALRLLSKKLELAPAGFVVVPEAMVHFLKIKEGSPPTAILLEVSEEEIAVSVVSQGKILGTEEVGRSDSLVADAIEALSRFAPERSLPSRILLFDSRQDLEDLRQRLLSHEWLASDEAGRRLPFLHIPKIEAAAADLALEAVAIAGGAEVARAAGLAVATPIPEEEAVAPLKEAVGQVEEEVPLSQIPTAPDQAAVFGFVKGEDILKISPPPEASPKVLPEEEKAKVEEEVSQEAVPEAEEEAQPPSSRLVSWTEFLAKLRPKTLPSIPRPRLPETGFKRPSFSLPSFRPPMLKLAGRAPLILAILGFGLLFFGGVLLAGYWFIPRAEVTLTVTSQTLEKEFEITIDSGEGEADLVNNIIPGTQVSARVSGQKTATTTGSKLVGERATGQVTVYNNTGSRKTFPEGTTITGPGGFQFSLDGEVVVASESGAPDYKPGEAKVGVTAADIGAEYNLAAGSVFSLATLVTADYSARNETAFSGGSSRQIQAVSDEDQARLSEALTAELAAQAAEKIRSQLSPGQQLVETSLVAEKVSAQFSHETGEEASQLAYNLETETTGLAYQTADLEGLVDLVLSEAVPLGFEVKKEATELSFEPKEVEEDGRAIFRVAATAYLLPKLDLEEVARNLSGKRPEVAREYLVNLQSVTGVEAKISPNLPPFLRTMPRLTRNIIIEMVIAEK